MTKESILENCQRLQVFLKDTPKYNLEEIINDLTPKGFINLYGRILDYNGAPATGWSWLYLTGEDYIELENFCKENCLDSYHGKPGISFGFQYEGYKWYVNNK